MNTFFRTTLVSTLLTAGFVSPVSATSLPPAPPFFNASLIRCVDSHFSKSLGTCGGDALVKGHIAMTPKATLIKADGALADPFNLYEVYWLALGDNVADAVLAGNVVTDCKGNARGALTTITTASDALNAATATPVVIYPTAGEMGAGVFLVYSRGPWAHDSDGDCVADTYNTIVNWADTDASHALANPPVIPGIDNVQFLSGYQLPAFPTEAETGSEPTEAAPTAPPETSAEAVMQPMMQTSRQPAPNRGFVPSSGAMPPQTGSTGETNGTPPTTQPGVSAEAAMQPMMQTSRQPAPNRGFVPNSEAMPPQTGSTGETSGTSPTTQPGVSAEAAMQPMMPGRPPREGENRLPPRAEGQSLQNGSLSDTTRQQPTRRTRR